MKDILKLSIILLKKIFIDDQFNISLFEITTSERLLKIMKKRLNSNSKIVKQKKNIEYLYHFK